MNGLLMLGATGAAIGAVHTLLGPDHYLPFVVLGRARGWSWRRTATTTVVCGLGHVGSSLLLGLGGIALGVAVAHLAHIETVRGSLAAWALIVVGTVYGAWGLHRALRGERHVHGPTQAKGKGSSIPPDTNSPRPTQLEHGADSRTSIHPEFLGAQRLPATPADLGDLWRQRYGSIRDHEEHLARCGTVVLKFWLNVSCDEQRRRFLDRIEEPHKNWKFSARDVAERHHWKGYMEAYEDALNATSRPHAPWYAIPADDKPFLRLAVAEVVVQALESLKLDYPKVGDAEKDRFAEMKAMLDGEG